MNAFLVMLEVALKTAIGLATGGGVGTLVFGVGLVMHGVSGFGGAGPPPGPLFIGLGAGLLATACTMLGLFLGPLSRRRWFDEAEPDDELPKKWKTAG